MSRNKHHDGEVQSSIAKGQPGKNCCIEYSNAPVKCGVPILLICLLLPLQWVGYCLIGPLFSLNYKHTEIQVDQSKTCYIQA